jgi:hypothetical protein
MYVTEIRATKFEGAGPGFPLLKMDDISQSLLDAIQINIIIYCK